MKDQLKLPSNAFTVAPGVWGRKDTFVNFYIILSGKMDWVLIDAGLKWSASKIKELAFSIFGKDIPARAIILTHGHFDHVGSLQKLAEEWDVPVYAHHHEIPYLTGMSSYPPADPSVGGGAMAYLSFLYPTSPINIWKHIKTLPSDGIVPELPGWKYIHTPGHTPGHISLFREDDKVLIAGDAFVTTKAESATAIMFQKKKVSGPPKYLTCDWQAARVSVEKLNNLKPSIAATGHGKPMRGDDLSKQLNNLAKTFNQKAVPDVGRYVPYPAITDANGVVYLPPDKSNKKGLAAATFIVSSLTSLAIVLLVRRRKKKQIEYDNYIDVEYNY